MKNLILLGIALLIACTHRLPDAAIPPLSFTISGISLGTSISSVEQSLGPPKQRSEHLDWISITLHYPGLELGFDEFTVQHMLATGSEHCTSEGVCPDDLMSEMTKAYGKADQILAQDDGSTLYRFTDRESCWYEFIVSFEQITSVAAACQP